MFFFSSSLSVFEGSARDFQGGGFGILSLTRVGNADLLCFTGIGYEGLVGGELGDSEREASYIVVSKDEAIGLISIRGPGS